MTATVVDVAASFRVTFGRRSITWTEGEGFGPDAEAAHLATAFARDGVVVTVTPTGPRIVADEDTLHGAYAAALAAVDSYGPRTSAVVTGDVPVWPTPPGAEA